MKLLIKQIYYSSCHLRPLRYNCSPQDCSQWIWPIYSWYFKYRISRCLYVALIFPYNTYDQFRGSW